ncbi:MAG: class I SAM-dependent methyltransferase [Siculibacillus sp.]|nr:class I SAM-dependent methyltransferase [Siculibacillus sp.]
MNDAGRPHDPLAGTFGRVAVAPDERRALIRATFEGVARRYDLMNDLMSLGIHRGWKDRFVGEADPRPGEIALDLAGGTGDVAFRLARRGATVTVVDPSAAMMEVGRARPGGGSVAWIEAEAESLPITDASVDLVTIAFGIRNVTRLDAALAEIHRVLKPGGRFFCLEFSRARWWLRPFYEAWSRTAIPVLGTVVSGRTEAYRYLIESIGRFPDQSGFAAIIARNGFEAVGWSDLSFGIAAIHHGRRPAPPSLPGELP